MRIAVILTAAGASTRYTEAGGVRHKLDEDLGDRPVLHRAVELFASRDDVATIIVAGPHDEAAFAEFRERHGAKLGFLGVKLCRGGRVHRWESVKAALGEVDESCTHVAVHDAARPCTPTDLIDRVFEAGRRFDAVIPGVPLADTVRRLAPEAEAEDSDPLDAILGGGGRTNAEIRSVSEEIPRDGLVLVQTPQLFARSLLLRAYSQGELDSTDDAGLVAKLGEPIRVVAGDARNLKITLPPDVELARSIMKLGPPRERPSHQRF